MKEGFCLVFYRTKTGRLYHWHWPRKGILDCTEAAKVAQEHAPR